MKWLIENLITLFYALLIALLIRSLIIQPFYIPSSSMEPNLLVGDRLFVTKNSYGYSKHSFPFSPNIYSKRIFFKEPKRGDVIVFKTPSDNRTDYIKRLIGIPGDIVQFINGDLYINSNQVLKTIKSNGKTYFASYRTDVSISDTEKYIVPNDHYFFLGDNRDCSKDSRFLNEVGYVNKLNLVGKAQFLFFSSDSRIASFFNFFRWKDTIRLNRFFKKII